MIKGFKKHIFVCENIRTGSQKSCGLKGKKIRSLLKKMVYDNKLNHEVRINRSGCLDQCEEGPCIVIYPDKLWVSKIKLSKCEDIFNKYVIIKKNK